MTSKRPTNFSKSVFAESAEITLDGPNVRLVTWETDDAGARSVVDIHLLDAGMFSVQSIAHKFSNHMPDEIELVMPSGMQPISSSVKQIETKMRKVIQFLLKTPKET